MKMWDGIYVPRTGGEQKDGDEVGLFRRNRPTSSAIHFPAPAGVNNLWGAWFAKMRSDPNGTNLSIHPFLIQTSAPKIRASGSGPLMTILHGKSLTYSQGLQGLQRRQGQSQALLRGRRMGVTKLLILKIGSYPSLRSIKILARIFIGYKWGSRLVWTAPKIF